MVQEFEHAQGAAPPLPRVVRLMGIGAGYGVGGWRADVDVLSGSLLSAEELPGFAQCPYVAWRLVLRGVDLHTKRTRTGGAVQRGAAEGGPPVR